MPNPDTQAVADIEATSAFQSLQAKVSAGLSDWVDHGTITTTIVLDGDTASGSWTSVTAGSAITLSGS